MLTILKTQQGYRCTIQPGRTLGRKGTPYGVNAHNLGELRQIVSHHFEDPTHTTSPDCPLCKRVAREAAAKRGARA